MSDIPKPTPPIQKSDDTLVVEDGKNNASKDGPNNMRVAQTLEGLTDLIHDHMANSKKRGHLSIIVIVAAAILAAVVYIGYQKLVVEPRLAQAIVLEQSAQKSIDDTKALTSVLLDSLSSQNPKLAKTIAGKLGALGFTQGVPK